MNPDPILTADDLIRAGACADGVYDVIKRIGKRQRIPAAMPLSAILPFLSSEEEHEYAMRAAQLDGCGNYGSGAADGSYSGTCGGYGYYYSFNSGDGFGGARDDYGYGLGYGSGDSHNCGDGSGSGVTYGSGNGCEGRYGSGCGDGCYGYSGE